MVTPTQIPFPKPRQAAVYRKYLQLQFVAERRFSCSLAGRLVLSVGFGVEGAELALATAIAGGTFLGIESDPQRLKVAVRNGSCDFMVNTLDEALRVLKNEIRKGTPLSTGLVGSAGDLLLAIVERGVQPDLIADNSWSENPEQPDEFQQALNQLVERGAEKLSANDIKDQEILSFGEVLWIAANPQDLRRMDTIALETIPPKDWIRRRWLEHAAGYFHRQVPLERVLGITAEEQVQLLDAFRRASSSSAFQSQAKFCCRGADQNMCTVDL